MEISLSFSLVTLQELGEGHQQILKNFTLQNLPDVLPALAGKSHALFAAQEGPGGIAVRLGFL